MKPHESHQNAGAFDWQTERLLNEARPYVTLEKNDTILDAGMKAVAGAIHFVTGTFESIVGDAARLLQGKEGSVPLARYPDSLPRLQLDVREALASVGNFFRGKFSAILNLPIIAFKSIGDAAADAADAVAGVRRSSS